MPLYVPQFLKDYLRDLCPFQFKLFVTLFEKKIIWLKIWMVMSSMNFALEEYSAPMRIEKIKIPGSPLGATS